METTTTGADATHTLASLLSDWFCTSLRYYGLSDDQLLRRLRSEGLTVTRTDLSRIKSGTISAEMATRISRVMSWPEPVFTKEGGSKPQSEDVFTLSAILSGWLREQMLASNLRNTDLINELDRQGYKISSSYVSGLKRGRLSYSRAHDIAKLMGWDLPVIPVSSLRAKEKSGRRGIVQRKIYLTTAQWLTENMRQSGLRPTPLTQRLRRYGVIYSRHQISNMKKYGISYAEAVTIANAMGWSLPAISLEM